MLDDEGTSRISTIFGATAALSRSGSCLNVTSLPLPKEIPAHAALAGMTETAPAAEINARVTHRRGLAARHNKFCMSDPPDNTEGMRMAGWIVWRLHHSVPNNDGPEALGACQLVLPHHCPSAATNL